MFTILIFEFVNHGYNKINIDIIVPTCYYQAWKKVQNLRIHIAHNLQVVWGLPLVAQHNNPFHFTNDLILTMYEHER